MPHLEMPAPLGADGDTVTCAGGVGEQISAAECWRNSAPDWNLAAEVKASPWDSNWGSRTSCHLRWETALICRVRKSQSGRDQPMQWPATPSPQLERAP